jgi:membrane-associated protease RseP (regulator of RpoE activity)
MKLKTTIALAAAGLLSIQAADGQPLVNPVEQRLQPPASGGAPGPAPARSGYLGFVPDEESDQGNGVRVKSVKAGAPAALGGLKDGDLITAVDGKGVKGLSQFDALLDRTSPGQKIQITIDRSGRSQQVTVTLGTPPTARPSADPTAGEPSQQTPSLTPPTGSSPATGSFSSPSASGGAGTAPSLTAPTGPGSPGAGGAPSLTPPTGTGASPVPSTLSTPSTPDSTPRGSGIRAQPLDLGAPPAAAGEAVPPPAPSGFGSSAAGAGGASLGITVVPLTEQARIEAGVPVRRGAVIAVIKPGSPADRAGLPVGGVIARIDGREVNSADDLVAAVRAARPGQEVELTYYEGNRLHRKLVRLAPAGAPGSTASVGDDPAGGGALGPLTAPGPAGTTPPGFSPRMGPGGLGGNRPLMQGIERLAENLTRPTGTSTVYDPLVIAALQTRVVELSEYAKELEERIRVLEAKVGVGGSAPTPSARPAAPGFGAPSSTPGAAPGFGPAAGGTGTNP